MAKKPASSGKGSTGSSAAPAVRPTRRAGGAAAKGSAAAKTRVTKPATKPATRAATAATPKARASKPKAAAKAPAAGKAAAPKAAVRVRPPATRTDVPPRTIIKDIRRQLPRNQPETLRCTALTVSLTADDLERSRAFYVDGLRFHVKDRWEVDGELRGLELVAGSCMLGLSQDDWAKGRDRNKGVGVRIHLETGHDLEMLAEGFRARGVPAHGPFDTAWGARMVHVTDPDGYQITFFREGTT